MEKIEMTEAEIKRLKVELEILEEQIRETRKEHTETLRDKQNLLNNSMISLLSQDIERWERRANLLREKLAHAIIVKVDKNSDEMVIDIGDIVEAKITYEGKNPMQLKLQIDGEDKIPGIMNVTFSSPIATALRGKKVGDTFTLEKSATCPTNAEGTILGLLKAKDFKSSIGESETKKPYILQKHS